MQSFRHNYYRNSKMKKKKKLSNKNLVEQRLKHISNQSILRIIMSGKT